MSGFENTLKTMLPDYHGTSAHITSSADGKNDFDDRTGHAANKHGGVHGGVDINYIGGQTASANRSRPEVYSPVSGTVIAVGSRKGYPGGVSIRDDKGFVHEMLHMERQKVTVGETVTAGQPIGHMSDVGSKGAIHVHYQVKDPSGQKVDPEKFWNDPSAVSTEDALPNPIDEDHEQAPLEVRDKQGNVDQGGGVMPPPSATQRLLPQQATQADASEADRALWTNRVPEHEPWPRVLKAQPQKDPSATQQYDDDSGMAYQDADEPERQQLNRHHTNEFPDGSAWVSRVEGNEFIERNPLWRR